MRAYRFCSFVFMSSSFIHEFQFYVMTLTITPAFSAISTIIAVLRPPGNTTTKSGFPPFSICELRMKPARLPCAFQSAENP